MTAKLPTRGGGRRLYRPEDMQLLATIDRLVHREGYTLRGARAAMDGGAKDAAPAAAAAPARNITPHLIAIRNELAAALAA
jgi:DNA-binding transcriptional MerR regulator